MTQHPPPEGRHDREAANPPVWRLRSTIIATMVLVFVAASAVVPFWPRLTTVQRE